MAKACGLDLPEVSYLLRYNSVGVHKTRVMFKNIVKDKTIPRVGSQSHGVPLNRLASISSPPPPFPFPNLFKEYYS